MPVSADAHISSLGYLWWSRLVSNNWRTWTIPRLRNSQQNFLKLLYIEEKADATPEVPRLRLKFQTHPFKLAQKSKLTWLAKTPGRVGAGEILEEYNRSYTTVKVISDKLTHPCEIELSSRPCILLLRLIWALFKENQRESRLSKDLALTNSITDIHHFPITFVLNWCCYLKAVNFLNSIIVWLSCMKQPYDYEYGSLI